MADSAGMVDEVLPAFDEIPNMKVADLRKKLKTFGLPTMGNKTELVERLQEACMPTKGTDSFESSHLSFDESQISELESADGSTAIEDGALLEQEHFSSYIDTSLNESKVLVSSENKIILHKSSTPVTKPLKKRTIASVTNESSVSEKKVVLNRTNIVHTELSIQSNSNSQPEPVESSNKIDTDGKRVLSVKNLSAAERMAMRAKRFNTSNKAVTTTSNLKSTNGRNSKQSILSSAPVTADLEVLKKRAERFGQSVSTVLKQIEQKEKLLKRKCKFGATLAASANLTVDEQSKKKQRAERFGVL